MNDWLLAHGAMQSGRVVRKRGEREKGSHVREVSERHVKCRQARSSMQIGKAARSNGSHIKSRLKMEPHGVFKEVTKQCTNKDHYQQCRERLGDQARRSLFGTLKRETIPKEGRRMTI